MHLTVAVSFSSSTNMDMSLKIFHFFLFYIAGRSSLVPVRDRRWIILLQSDVAARLSSRGGRSVSQWGCSVLKEHRIPQVMDA